MAKSKVTQVQKSTSEIERRFLVHGYDPKILRARSHFIEQGYFDKTRDLRVRIVDGKIGILTRKTGRGLVRLEENCPINLRAARFQLDSTPYVLEKRRYLKDGWEFDVFEGPLAGLTLAEFEMKKASQVIVLPKWIKSCTEVTDTLSNRLLAHVAYDLSCENDGETRAIKDYLPKRVPAFVLTGPPCSGKSTLMEMFKKDFGTTLHCVPETATIVIETVGIKPPVGDPVAMRAFQRTIYRVQHSFEKASHQQAARDKKVALLLDRGTIDGAAYMANGLASLERICETTIVDEYGRYDGVICLDLPPPEAYEEHRRSNPARTETYAQASALRDRMRAVWEKHPNFAFVKSNSWEEKVQSARMAFMRCIESCRRQ